MIPHASAKPLDRRCELNTRQQPVSTTQSARSHTRFRFVTIRFDRPTLAGAVLPFAAIGIGLLIPRSPLTEALFPGVFVTSGALIGCWWAPVPALVAAIALNLLDLTDVHHYAAIEIHGGRFDLRF